MVATVYVLHSANEDKYYVGSCKEFSLRFYQHVQKEFPHSFTAKINDWDIFCKIDNLSYKQARKIEQHIKKMKSKNYIINLKKFPEMISKLTSRYPYN